MSEMVSYNAKDEFLDRWMEFFGDPNAAVMLLATAEGRLAPEMVYAEDVASVSARRKRLVTDYYYASAEKQEELRAIAQTFVSEYGLLTNEGYSKANFIPEREAS